MGRMSAKLQEQFPTVSSLDADLKKQEDLVKKLDKFVQDDEAPSDEPQMKLKFSADLVIQSEQFLTRWCPNRPDDTHRIQRVLPTVKEFLAIKCLPVEERGR